MEEESYALPDFSTTPTDSQLVEEHLRPIRQRYLEEWMNLPTLGVNRRFPRTDPRLLPGMPSESDKEAGKRREKYFLTDCPDMALALFFGKSRVPQAPQGYWKRRGERRGWGWVIRDGSNPSRIVGLKTTFDFHTAHPSDGFTKTTNWVMNVYSIVKPNGYAQPDLVLCHVFENKSRDYDPRPKCAAFHQPPNGKGTLSSTHLCSYEHPGKPCNQAIHGPSSSSSLSTHPASDQTSHPALTSYIEGLKNLLLGEPDTSTDTGSYDAGGGGRENGQSRKRTRTSPVWERFTKIFARGPDGVKVTFAVCNHCCKVITGDSNKGTSHIARHKCQCNHGNQLGA